MKNKKLLICLGAIIILFNIFTFWLFETDVYAGDLIVNSNTTLEAGLHNYDDVLITNGATLTFNGTTTLNAININIDLNSSISVSADGSVSGSNAGDIYITANNINVLGSITAIGATGDVNPKSDGGNGGNISITSSILTISGAIKSDGSNGGGYFNRQYRGGIGGNININAKTYLYGIISANGGNGGSAYSQYYDGGDGGDGGDITINYIESTSTIASVHANGGLGSDSSPYRIANDGNGGKVVVNSIASEFSGSIETNGEKAGTIEIISPSNFTISGILTANGNEGIISFIDSDFVISGSVIANGGKINFSAGDVEVSGYISANEIKLISDNLNISSNIWCKESIDLVIKEYLEISGLVSVNGSISGSNAGDIYITANNINVLGSITAIGATGDVNPKSDGGNGGNISITSSILTISGAIKSDGSNGGGYFSRQYRGGIGGNININTESLIGSGIITTNGGNGGSSYSKYYIGGDGGDGGLINIYYHSLLFTGNVLANAGLGSYSSPYLIAEDGIPGTINFNEINQVIGQKIRLLSNNEFIIEENSQGTYSVQLDNQDSISHSATLSILNPYPDLVVTLGQENITLLSGEAATIAIDVDTSTALPGVYDIQIEIAGDDGSIIYSNIRIYVTEPAAGDLPDLTLTAQDVYFSNVNPFPDDTVIISARIHNKGASPASNISGISVKFFEFDTLINEVFLEAIPTNSSKVASVFASFSYAGEHFIRVVVDQSDKIPELAENNNEASQILQVGSPPEFTGSILVTGHMPSTIIEDSSFTVAGKAVYEIFVNGERNTDYVVKGGSVQITVIEDGGAGREWVYADIYTDVYGNFSKVLRAPDVLGTYHVIMTVTDKTFEGSREMFFEVVSQPPTTTPPSPPTSSGIGSWIPSGGDWTWEWTSTPVHEPVPVSDVYVHSEDIYFSSFNPAIGEEISITAYIHFWSNSSLISAENVPVNFYVTYPGYPKIKIGETVIPSISVGEPDYGSSWVFASWKNYAEGIYIVEVEIDPSYEEDNQYNNAATRAILVGQLQSEHDGAVSGHVTDPWGGASGVTLRLNDSNGTLRSTVTDGTGSYLFADIPAGNYGVQIIVPDGYETDSELKPTVVDQNSISVVDFHITIADNDGPITTEVLTDLNPVQIAGMINLTAFVDDTETGNSNISSAEYSLDAGATWFPMDAQDGAFDLPSEWVELAFTAPEIPGVYELCVRGTDSYGNIGPEECIFLVVYDPDGGFVTGGGWIDSPAGAYTADPTLTGKANFGFVSKYKKGATTPTGETEFQFKVADLNFHSDTYQWLVIAGARAKYKGTGTINGSGNYGFMLTAIDEKLMPSTDVDLFRIKIWDKDDGDSIVYDNQIEDNDDTNPSTEIGGGSIVIQKAK